MLSGNMYLYYENNPICCVDPTGSIGSFFDFPVIHGGSYADVPVHAG